MGFSKNIKQVINLALNFYKFAAIDTTLSDEIASFDYEAKINDYNAYISTPKALSLIDGLEISRITSKGLETLSEIDEEAFYVQLNNDVRELASLSFIYMNEYKGYQELIDSVELFEENYLNNIDLLFDSPEDYFDDTDSTFILDVDDEDFHQDLEKLKIPIQIILNYLSAIKIMIKSKDLHDEYKRNGEKSPSEKDMDNQTLIFKDLTGEGTIVQEVGGDVQLDTSVNKDKGENLGLRTFTVSHVDMADSLRQKLENLKSEASVNIEKSLIFLKSLDVPSIKNINALSKNEELGVSKKDIDFLNKNFNKVHNETLRKQPDSISKDYLDLLRSSLDQYIDIDVNLDEFSSKLEKIKSLEEPIKDLNRSLMNEADGLLVKLNAELSSLKDRLKKAKLDRIKVLRNHQTKVKKIEYDLKIETKEDVINSLNLQLKSLAENRSKDLASKEAIISGIESEIARAKERFLSDNGSYLGSPKFLIDKMNEKIKNLESARLSTDNVIQVANINNELKSLTSDKNSLQNSSNEYFNLYNEFNSRLNKIKINRVAKIRSLSAKIDIYSKNNSHITIDKIISNSKNDKEEIILKINNTKDLVNEVNKIKKDILEKIDISSKVLISNLRLSKGVSSGNHFLPIITNLKKSIESINPKDVRTELNPNGKLSLDGLKENLLKNINDFNNLLENVRFSSATLSKNWVNNPDINKDYIVLLSNNQNIISGYITNEFSYAAFRDMAFKQFIESESVKKELLKLKPEYMQNDSASKTIDVNRDAFMVNALVDAPEIQNNLNAYLVAKNKNNAIFNKFRNEHILTLQKIESIGNYTDLTSILKPIFSSEDHLNAYNVVPGNSESNKISFLTELKKKTGYSKDPNIKLLNKIIKDFQTIFDGISLEIKYLNALNDSMNSDKESSLKSKLQNNKITEKVYNETINMIKSLMNSQKITSNKHFIDVLNTSKRDFWRNFNGMINIFLNKYKQSFNVDGFINFYKSIRDLNNEIISLLTLSKMIDSNYYINGDISLNLEDLRKHVMSDKFNKSSLSKPMKSFDKEQVGYVLNLKTKSVTNLGLHGAKNNIISILREMENNYKQIAAGLVKYKIFLTQEPADNVKSKLETIIASGKLYVSKLDIYLDSLKAPEKIVELKEPEQSIEIPEEPVVSDDIDISDLDIGEEIGDLSELNLDLGDNDIDIGEEIGDFSNQPTEEPTEEPSEEEDFSTSDEDMYESLKSIK